MAEPTTTSVVNFSPFSLTDKRPVSRQWKHFICLGIGENRTSFFFYKFDVQDLFGVNPISTPALEIHPV